MNSDQNCSNCGAKTSGVFNNNFPLLKSSVDFINEFKGLSNPSYCNKCGDNLVVEIKANLLKERNELNNSIQNLFPSIPIVSAQSPLNWDYDIVDIVTGQSVTGTGVISEFTSAFTDMFGMQSERYNNKIRKGEDLCFSQLRKKALDLGANAILAVDIDYSEIGGDKGMIMVCMTGTAIKLKNIEIFGNERAESIATLKEKINRFNLIKKYSLD